MFQDVAFDVIRQGLPTIGAAGGLAYTLAGPSRSKGKTALFGALGAGVGWAAGYILRSGILWAVDHLGGTPLPTQVASIHAAKTGPLGYTEPGTMPNPTYDHSFAQEANMPKPVILDGEASQVINLREKASARAQSTGQDQDAQIQGTLTTNAYGKL